LKPANIFLDSNGSVKIGDFGLAIASKAGTDNTITSSDGAATPRAGDDYSKEGLSGGVGTAAYRAPELDNAAANLVYDGAVDMFSVGVILFEMCHRKFDTEMERFVTLRRLKENQQVSDEYLEGAAAAHFKDVVLQLVQSDPRKRFTSSGLLVSKVFPPQIDPTYFAELTANLLDPNSEALVKILSILFDPSPHQVNANTMDDSHSQDNDLNYDNDYIAQQRRVIERDKTKEADRHLFKRKHLGSSILNKKKTGNRLMKFGYSQFNSYFQLEAHVHEYLQNLFKSYGAVSFAPSLVHVKPRTPQQTNSVGPAKESAEFLDRTGDVVCLPDDLTVPFARYVALLNISRCRRYQVRCNYCFLAVFYVKL
jgi:serine/threonine protein kinase